MANNVKINMEKLNHYLNNGMIQEFDSDEACMEYFNTKYLLDFKNVEEMKEHQGWFGFNVGEKRYYICFCDALDVWTYYEVQKVFTYKELSMLSDGLLALIRNTNQALQLLASDKDCIETLQGLTQKYKDLNDKVCRLMD